MRVFDSNETMIHVGDRVAAYDASDGENNAYCCPAGVIVHVEEEAEDGTARVTVEHDAADSDGDRVITYTARHRSTLGGHDYDAEELTVSGVA
jgi:hypothetical protein